jgi:signal transduction histidine kinase
LANLVKNSVDFVPEKGGKITIRAEAEQSDQKNNASSSFVMFTISDNGSGIPIEKIEKLFIKFYQTDTSVSRKHGGTGLGLAICKGIIQAHGGRIWVDEHYTGGASIKFTLPSAHSTSQTKNNSLQS